MKMKKSISFALRTSAAALLLTAGAVSLVYADDGNKNNNNNNNANAEVRLRTRLSGAAIGGVVPEGNGDFRSRPDRGRTDLNVEVEHVNLPANTVLTVTVKVPNSAASVTIGTIKLSALGGGEVELSSQDGDTVPAVLTGTMVTVSNGATPILTGVF